MKNMVDVNLYPDLCTIVKIPTRLFQLRIYNAVTCFRFADPVGRHDTPRVSERCEYLRVSKNIPIPWVKCNDGGE